MDRRDLDELRRMRDSLIAQIERDFAGVTCSNGISIEDAETELYTTEESLCRTGRKIEPWREVDVAEKDPNGSATSFMDPVAFQYYLPAYMCFMLRDGLYKLEGELTDHPITQYFIWHLGGEEECYDADQWQLLTSGQRLSVARFLAIAAEASHEGFRHEPLRALQHCWMRYLPEDEQAELCERWPQLRA